MKASSALADSQLITADFRHTALHTRTGDFVFFDPPYPRGSSEQVGFNRYASDFFSLSDHRDLASIIETLTKRSAQVMLTLADSEHLLSLYPSSLRRKRVLSKALIACNGSDRKQITEVILTNY